MHKDVALAVEQIIAELREIQRLLCAHQIAFCRKYLSHDALPPSLLLRGLIVLLEDFFVHAIEL